MILKDKDPLLGVKDRKVLAGEKNEKDLAFYLRRAFKDREDVLVINDLRINHNDEFAQIDHLIVTELGFCLVESKSIKAAVNINKQGEWSRAYAGKQAGIPSPIKQVELQERLLKDLLKHNRAEIIGKFMGLQQGFSGRRWVSLCAVSSDAVINREYLPKDLSERVLKIEFIADWINENVTVKQGFGKKLRTLKTTDPVFTTNELKSLGDFLLSQHTPLNPAVPNSMAATPIEKVNGDSKCLNEQVSCKQCGSGDRLVGEYGRYGYFVKCECGANTSMKRSCPLCQSAMKIQKRRESYTANCECGKSFLVHKDTVAT